MRWYKDIHGRQIRFTDERWKHIKIDHPEMSENTDTIKRDQMLWEKK
ncbi:MAG: hypothetical protein Q7J76_08335 [Candidatus Brocadiaceae bacterium]|nr:hypothetical protein [Candidatus Brocadiaceae bacterium]